MVVERLEYTHGTIGEGDLLSDPMVQLGRWIEAAKEAEVIEPTAMSLATVDADGRPSCRIVLLRGLDERGLTFYTNYESRKGEALAAHPLAAATFWWGALERQVRVEGEVQRVSSEKSDAYFNGRPLKSRWASASSPQSQVVPSREVLEKGMADLRNEFPEGPPRPDHWGGYLLIPDRIEFWQGRRARLHDRFLYVRKEDDWEISRLAP